MQAYSLTNSIPNARIKLVIVLVAIGFGLAGCKTERIGDTYVTTATIKPVDVAKMNLRTPNEITLPISGVVYVDISNKDSIFKGHKCPQYSVGRLVRIAAVDVFQKGFTTVSSELSNPADADLAHLVLRTKSEVTMNCKLGFGFSTTVTSRIYKADGSTIGEYSKSERVSTFLLDISGTNTKLRNTFTKMHANILEQLLSDEKLLVLYREGYFESLPMGAEFLKTDYLAKHTTE